MGFLDKAKQMAEQAQQKLEKTQQQFNQGQAGKAAGGGGDAVRYDANGRPIAAEPTVGGTPASDPATAQAVGQPQPPAAAEPIEDQPSEPQPVKPGVNPSPDPFKPIE